MKDLTRRTLFASSLGIATAMAGCNDTQSSVDFSDGSDGDNSGGAPGSGSDGSSLIDEDDKNTLIPEDSYEGWTLSPTQDFRLEYDFIVRDGPHIDAIVLDESERSHYEDGDRFKYIPAASALDSSGDTVSAELSAGDYLLAFDNTGAGDAQPPSNLDDDTVELEASMQMYTL